MNRHTENLSFITVCPYVSRILFLFAIFNLSLCTKLDHKFRRVSNRNTWFNHEIEGLQSSHCGKYQWPHDKRSDMISPNHEQLSRGVSFNMSGSDPVAIKRLSHGSESRLKQFPSFVRIELYNSTSDIGTVCGGTIVARDIVITAAHCIKDVHNTARITAGIVNMNSDLDGTFIYRQQVYALNICLHKDYKPLEFGELMISMRDIAVIQLASKLNLTDSVQPACLPSEPIENNHHLYTIGMGQVADNESSESLNYVAVVEDDDCEFQVDITWDSCYAPSPWGEFCFGDSGSGLILIKGDRQYLVGITSSNVREECGDYRRTPGNYADLYKERFEIRRMLHYCYERIDY